MIKQVYGKQRPCHSCHIKTAQYEYVFEVGEFIFHQSCFRKERRKAEAQPVKSVKQPYVRVYPASFIH